MKRTASAIPTTHATSNATLHGLFADGNNLCINALNIQGLCHFTQCQERIAVLFWASIN
jgi:hypothetical protein